MNRRQKSEVRSQKSDFMFSVLCLLSSVFCLLLIITPAYSANKGIMRGDEPAVVEHMIKIEGSVERPRVIFIVPRSKLWRDDIFKKSFIADILRPVYPKLSIKEGGPDKDSRR
ncbi:MAG: hypothetical protein HY096_04445 [Nitrospinae bacterium]|nr:hypothetical protein [Nitrospinota bacterium]